MKSIIYTSLFVMVLVSAHRFAGTNSSAFKKRPSTYLNNSIPKFDTFLAVRIIRGGNPPKTIARDTIILVMQDLPDAPPIKRAAGINYSFEMIPYNPFDTITTSKAAAKDTLIWTAKPFRT